MSSKDIFTANTTSFEFDWPESITALERVFMISNGDLQRLLSAFFAKPIQAEVVSTETKFSSEEHVTAGSTNGDPAPPKGDTAISGRVLTQKRSINLLVDGAVVCRAQSTVVASSPVAIDLLQRGFFLGQTMRTLQQIPDFQLREVRVWNERSAGSSAADADVGQVSHDACAGGAEPDMASNEPAPTCRRASTTAEVQGWSNADQLEGREPIQRHMSRRYTVKVVGMECDIEEHFPNRAMFLQL